MRSLLRVLVYSWDKFVYLGKFVYQSRHLDNHQKPGGTPSELHSFSFRTSVGEAVRRMFKGKYFR